MNSIKWLTGNPPKVGFYLIYTYDGFYFKNLIKTRYWTGRGWDYGDNYIKFWAEMPNLPEGAKL